MDSHQIAIVALLAIEAVTLYALWLTKKDADQWRKAWMMTAEELLFWKRYAVLRDPKSGKYIKKAKRP